MELTIESLEWALEEFRKGRPEYRPPVWNMPLRCAMCGDRRLYLIVGYSVPEPFVCHKCEPSNP
jgi:hypothetical protein